MGDTTTGRERGWGARGSAGFWGLQCSLPDPALSTLPPALTPCGDLTGHPQSCQGHMPSTLALSSRSHAVCSGSVSRTLPAGLLWSVSLSGVANPGLSPPSAHAAPPSPGVPVQTARPRAAERP